MESTIDLVRYKKIITKLAGKVYKQDSSLDFEDLIQVGYETVLKASKKFKPNGKASLDTYLYRCILRALRREQNLQQNIISIPRGIMDYTGYLYRAEQLFNDKNRIIQYIIDNTTLSENQAETLYNYKILAQKKYIDSEVMNELIGYYNNDIDNRIDNERLRKSLEYLTSFLPINQRVVIELKYFSDKEYSFEDIAKLLGKNIENVWNAHRLAIKQLRKRYKSKFKERI